jgi:hypothetical protein
MSTNSRTIEKSQTIAGVEIRLLPQLEAQDRQRSCASSMTGVR